MMSYREEFNVTLQNTEMSLSLPKVILGTSTLGNIFQELPYEQKLELVKEHIRVSPKPAVFDSAGKYGAGLALEVLGNCLRDLEIDPSEVIISNKLAWIRTELKTEEPTFEPGVWKNLKHDAVQSISYEGILACFEQGNQLLGNTYIPQMISVHDPDEYLAAAKNDADREKRFEDILGAYKALTELKAKNLVSSIGVGSKTWNVIHKIDQYVKLDWVMFANSMTIYSHPKDLISFIQHLHAKGVKIINSALFHGGFLMGSDYFDYKLVNPETEEAKRLFKWRSDFFALCNEFKIKPAEAAIYFGMHIPGVVSVALSSTSTSRVRENAYCAEVVIPKEFWNEMKSRKLIAQDYPFL